MTSYVSNTQLAVIRNITSSEFYFLAKPLRSQRPAYPCTGANAARGNHNVHIHALIVHVPCAGNGFMPFHKKGPNRFETLSPLENIITALNIGRTLFVEGHEALPCTGTYDVGNLSDGYHTFSPAIFHPSMHRFSFEKLTSIFITLRGSQAKGLA